MPVVPFGTVAQVQSSGPLNQLFVMLAVFLLGWLGLHGTVVALINPTFAFKDWF
jgi:hypothetical protein